MKKIILGILAVLTVVSLTACQDDNKVNPPVDNTPQVTEQPVAPTPEPTPELPAEETNEQMYEEILNDYREAIKEYDINNLETEDSVKEKYPLVSQTLLFHVARYNGDGVKLTYAFQDVDGNGTDELLMGADNAIGAIYAYDKDAKQVTKVFEQSTLERGNLTIYDNGIIESDGSGGAALHYYEFGKIADDGFSYEQILDVEEEYMQESETPVYRDANTKDSLVYQSLEEIMDNVVAGGNSVSDITFIEL